MSEERTSLTAVAAAVHWNVLCCMHLLLVKLVKYLVCFLYRLCWWNTEDDKDSIDGQVLKNLKNTLQSFSPALIS